MTHNPSIRQQLIRAEKLIHSEQKVAAQGILHGLLSQQIDNADDLYLTGVIAYNLDLFNPAANLIKKAIDKDSSKPAYYTLCGLALAQCHQYVLAEQFLQKAIQMQPNNAEYMTNLGTLYQSSGRPRDAEKTFLNALTLKKDDIAALYGIANLFMREFNDKGAKKYARLALKYDPKHAASHLILCQVYRREKELNKEITELKKLIRNHPTFASASYELGHILQKQKKYNEAKQAFDQANTIQDPGYLKKEQIDHEYKEFTQVIDAIKPIDACSQENIIAHAIAPVFILGSPRSGTTLLSSMLGQHKKLYPAGELSYIYDLYVELNQKIGQPDDEAKIIEHLWQPVDQPFQQTLLNAYTQRLNQHAEHLKKGCRIIDKTPFNVQRFPMIAKITPHSPIIHIIRDGREVSWSNYTQNYSNYHWHAHSLENGIVTWERNIVLARKCAEKFQLNYIEIKYEDLVTDPENTLQTLLNFLQLDWDNNCLENYKNHDTPILTASFEQVKQDLYTSSLNKSKNYPQNYAVMTQLAENMLTELGYEIA